MNAADGLIHIYTGGGKGKTTAAAGLCVRCIGAGKRVLFAQFLKGRPTCELEPLRRLGAEVRRTDPVVKFFKAMDEKERSECVSSCRALFDGAASALRSGEFGLVVLDEVLDAVKLGILSEDEVCAALAGRARHVEVALTGRSPGGRLLAAADYISEISAVRHPYEKGAAARRGIEF